MSWNMWYTIERINKLFNIYLGLTMVFEKHILSLFMIYQTTFPTTQHDVMKDKFRQVEAKELRLYWYYIIGVTVFILTTIVVPFFLPWESNNDHYILFKTGINLFILGIQGMVLRRYQYTSLYFLNLMKKHYHHEYERHKVREWSLSILLWVSFVIIDLANVLIFSLDCVNLVCKQFFIEANLN